MPIRLIVGLGNPGPTYEQTRHNAGAWALQHILQEYQATLSRQRHLFGLYANVRIENTACHFLMPTTFINQSGSSVHAVIQYYKIPLSSVLIIHDDLDLSPGIIRLKQDGGSAGHNGIKNIISVCKGSNFLRLRIGIGHPGIKAYVSNYVLSAPSVSEYSRIQATIQKINAILPLLVGGNTELAMQMLHTPEQS